MEFPDSVTGSAFLSLASHGQDPLVRIFRTYLFNFYHYMIINSGLPRSQNSMLVLWIGHSGRAVRPVQTQPCHPPSSVSSGGLPVISAVKRNVEGVCRGGVL